MKNDSQTHKSPTIKPPQKEDEKTKSFHYETSFYKGYLDYPVFVRIWKKVEEAKGIVLVAHNIREHSGFYEEFALTLNKVGYIVVVPDLRAHGKTAGEVDNCGKYDGKNFFQDSVLDLIKFADWMFKRFDLPLAIMGVGIGSFLVQKFAENYHRHRAMILIGAGYYPIPYLNHINFLANMTAMFKGKNAPAHKVYKATIGKFEKNFPDKNWLTHDESMIEIYEQDPYYGHIPSAAICASIAQGIASVFTGNNLDKLDRFTPILFENGQNDTIATASPTNLDKLLEQYKFLQFKNVETKIWDHDRHDILHETDRKQVFSHISAFLKKNVIP
ncbi:MAG: alpha/beta hydrolase [Clostridia bacterium]|nr:alpha/beta hydrolase [Clostridia bacterium]